MAAAPKDQYDKAETARRLDALMRGAFSGPPKTYEDSKLGKTRGKKAASPTKPGRKAQAKPRV